MRCAFKHLSIFSLLTVSLACSAVEYYVSPTGNDNLNDGRSIAKPFGTIQHAADLTIPGDVVNVMNGIYQAPADLANFVEITRAGKPNAWITYRALPGHKPKLQTKGWQVFAIKRWKMEGNRICKCHR